MCRAVFFYHDSEMLKDLLLGMMWRVEKVFEFEGHPSSIAFEDGDFHLLFFFRISRKVVTVR